MANSRVGRTPISTPKMHVREHQETVSIAAARAARRKRRLPANADRNAIIRQLILESREKP